MHCSDSREVIIPVRFEGCCDFCCAFFRVFSLAVVSCIDALRGRETACLRMEIRKWRFHMNYRNMTLLQLRAAAKEKGLRGISALKKEQLIERLMELESSSNGEKQSAHVHEGGRTERTTRVRAEREPGENNGRERMNSRESAGRQEHERVNGERPEYERRNGDRTEYGRRNGDQTNYERRMDDRADYERAEAVHDGGQEHGRNENGMKSELESLDSGEKANGILEVMPDGYGFIRCENYLPGENDVYVSPAQIRRFGLKTGDILTGNTRIKTQGEKFSALLYVSTVNGLRPAEAMKRKNFEDLTPIFPNKRIRLEQAGSSTAMRIMDLMSPIGKGQRGMIVSPPKAGKTTLLKEVALSVQKSEPHMHLLILLIDERPEEVTDIKEAISGPNVEVIHSTFDELPEHHKRVSEMVISRAKRLVEHGKDVMILLDSITRLSRAYNLIVPPSGRTLSGGLDPAALYSPKRFFGAARNMREGGSLTILATALVDTGSKMDDVVYEEFKGTGNMELILDRKLQERRVFPAIDIAKSGTRREDLLLTKDEQDAVYIMRRGLNGMKAEEAADNLLNMFSRTKTNSELVHQVIRQKFI